MTDIDTNGKDKGKIKYIDDDVTSERRRVALSDAIHEAIDAWAERFRDEANFEPDKELCFCLALKLGCFIAAADDEPTREILRDGTRRAIDDAISCSLDLHSAEGELLKLMAERREVSP